MMASKPKIAPWPRRKVQSPPGLVNVTDVEGTKQNLVRLSKQLYREDGMVEVVACRWSEKEKLTPSPIKSYDQLDTYLRSEFGDSQTPSNPPTHLFLIDQSHSKAGLNISEAGLNLLLDQIDAFPQLGNALSAFAASDTPFHEGRSDFYASPTSGSTCQEYFELCMLLKYVELNGNASDPIPYSIRQVLFYQNFQHKRDASMLIRSSATMRRRIQEEYCTTDGVIHHWTDLPAILISTLSSGWAEYAKFLDSGVWKIDTSTSFTNPFSQTLGEANYETLQATKTFHDLLTRATNALQNNIRVLETLTRLVEKRKKLPNGGLDHHTQYDLLQNVIGDQKSELLSYIRHFDLMQSRLTRITEAIRDSITLRSSDHAAIESDAMRHLTHQSIREARTVKAIALVTLIYLPATFVATFLGMEYISVSGSRKNGLLEINARPDLWVYLAITAPLTLGTLFGWWAWEKWSRRGKGKDDAGRPKALRDVDVV